MSEGSSPRTPSEPHQSRDGAASPSEHASDGVPQDPASRADDPGASRDVAAEPGESGEGQTRSEAPSSAYDLLIARLGQIGTELRAASNQLNEARSAAFSSAEILLGEQERIATELTCSPRDAVALDDLLLVGFHFPSTTSGHRTAAEAFSLFRVVPKSDMDWDLLPIAAGDPRYFIGDAGFVRDVGEMFTYYADARLISLANTGEQLRMVFSVGSNDEDVRVYRWRLGRPGELPIYIDAFGESDALETPRYDMEWATLDREDFVEGRDPHWRLLDGLTLALEDGKLSFKVPDLVHGTRSCFLDEVQQRSQDVGELVIAIADVGEVQLIRIHPYREALRHYIFNRLTRSVQRVDAIGFGCHQLPASQGVVFPGGYHLQNGETRVFTLGTSLAGGAQGFQLQAVIRSPNGEDLLYAYHRPKTGDYLLCAYNLVTRTMATPLVAHGYGVFSDGAMVTIRQAPEPQRVHTLSLYTSPFCAPEKYQPKIATDSFLGRIGNPELVAALGELLSLATDALHPEFLHEVFEALVARSTTLIDTYGWLQQGEAHGIAELLVSLRRAAGSVLDEFNAVAAAQRDANTAVQDHVLLAGAYAAEAQLEVRDTTTYLRLVADGRVLLGELSELGDQRYVDQTKVQECVEQVRGSYLALANRAITFLGTDGALSAQFEEFDAAERSGAAAATAQELSVLSASIDESGQRLVMLTEVVGGLEVEDPTHKTAVLSQLASALARRNTVRAGLEVRLRQLRQQESAGGFQAALSVLGQRATGSLMSVATTADADLALSTLFAELESLEVQYGDVAECAEALAQKRDELTSAFGRTRDALGAERTARIDRIETSARRVLQTLSQRAGTLADRAAVDGYFATDPLVGKVKSTVEDLTRLGETGRASTLSQALTTARDTARRLARDRAELFDAGTVALGRWRFGVNEEPFELRLEPRTPADVASSPSMPSQTIGTGASAGPASEGSATWTLRLTGTDLRLPLPGTELDQFSDLADRVWPSETATLPRALFLAFAAIESGISPSELGAFASSRLEEGYEMGVHDNDAALCMSAMMASINAGLVVGAAERSVAQEWYNSLDRTQSEPVRRELIAIKSLGQGATLKGLIARAHPELAALARNSDLEIDTAVAMSELVERAGTPIVSQTGADDAEILRKFATESGLSIENAPFSAVMSWARDLLGGDSLAAAEAVLAVRVPGVRVAAGVPRTVEVSGLVSAHPSIEVGTLKVDTATMFTAFRRERTTGSARFLEFHSARRAALESWRNELSLDSLRPRVLSSFVRNRLVNEVLLPLIADNFARQLGMNGPNQGMLLLISPPGYGKTTLVEYLCDLLGVALVKINGPALGTGVVSLDPAVAPDQASAAELVKLNRGFAMGNNTVVYVDDIQHTSPEFLQKFISLCDATRTVEGVLDGSPETFNLAGKRFAVVMAGNPYTSDGDAFRIPDMLANRSDVHNLGDMVAGPAGQAFADSYLENACGVNEVLSAVASRGGDDLQRFIEAANGSPLRSEQLSYSYSAKELADVSATLQHMMVIRDCLLRVNSAYIASAARSEDLRGEPAFLLQGSYRNMARLAAQVLPQMNRAEVDQLVTAHYHNESQTLAAAGSWNLAKLAEVLGTAGPAELEALDAMRESWRAANVGDDPMVAMAAALRGIRDALVTPLEGLHAAKENATAKATTPRTSAPPPEEEPALND